MKKKMLVVSVLLLSVVLLSGCGSAKLKNGEEIVFSVNGSKITADKMYKDLRDKYAKNLIVDTIDKEILDDVYKNDKDIETQAKNAIESMKAQYSDKWDETLESAGFDNEDDLLAYYKLSYQRKKAIDDYIKESIDDKKIKDYYENKMAGNIRCKHILIKVKDDNSQDGEGLSDGDAKKKAEDLIKQLNDGADFSKLAKENSNDTGSASKGGDLGFFGKGEMVSEFEDAAYKLKVNEYTKEPIKTTYGYHIILKTDEKEKAKLSKVKNTITEKLVEQAKKDDPTIEVTALDKLRKKYNLKFKDKKYKKYYNKYIESSKKSAEESAKSSNNAS